MAAAVVPAPALDPAQVVRDYEALKVARSATPSRSASNRSSEIGHPCAAYLALSRLRGEAKEAPGPKLAAIFDMGRVMERQITKDLLDAGYTIEGGQRALYWNKFNISGHIDFTISRDCSEQIHCDVKALSPFLWDGISTEADVRGHRWHVIRKYASQFDAYMLQLGVEKFWMLSLNKSSGLLRVIPFGLDYGNAEACLQRVERVNAAVAIGERSYEQFEAEALPGLRINDPQYCEDCPFAAICLPDLAFDAARVVEDGEFLAALDARERLKDAVDRYKEADDLVKERAKAALAGDGAPPSLIAGQWQITAKTLERKPYTVSGGSYQRVDIRRIGGDK